jgi:purine-cytosine permease-like protein
MAYLALIAIFFFVTFQTPGDLFMGFIGTLAASVGAIRIADWFISRRLEPGSPDDSPGFWT